MGGFDLILPHLHVVTGLTIFSAHVQNNDLGWVVEWAGGVDGWLVNFCIRVAGDVFGGDGNDLIEFQVAAGLQLSMLCMYCFPETKSALLISTNLPPCPTRGGLTLFIRLD